MVDEVEVISLGAGVQSSTMLLMAIHGEIEPKPDCAIFADTGWEPQRVYDWLEFLKFKCEQAGIPLITVRHGDLRQDTIDRIEGKSQRSASMPMYVQKSEETYFVSLWKQEKEDASKLMRMCTTDYKIVPIEKKVRELLGYKPRQIIKGKPVNMWVGISVDEVERAGENKTKWIKNRHPLLEKGLTRHDCMLWLQKHGYPIPPKSSCIACPFHDNHHWREMRDEHPDEWLDAVEFDKKARKIPKVDGSTFLHRSLLPLDEVDLRTDNEKGQLTLDLFTEECTGYCGL